MRNNKKNKYTLRNTKWGFKTLFPIPEAKTLSHFYQGEYYKKLSKKGGTREAKLFQKSTEVRKKELAWMHNIYFTDRLFYLQSLLKENKRKKILDVGCGTGEFLGYMKKNGWDIYGIEPSYDAWMFSGLVKKDIFNGSLEDFTSDKKHRGAFDVVTFLNVLEHIPRPEKVVTIAKTLLKKDGIIMVQVPNDFNPFQLLADRVVKKKQWWVTIPDHINYFDFASLSNLLKHSGFRVRIKIADFPMELFLLMGENYVDEKEKGAVCHEKRIAFESHFSADARRTLYQKLASSGIGRQCIIYAQKI